MFTAHKNMTLVERIHCCVGKRENEKARALAKVGDYLEECWQLEIDFGSHLLIRPY